ncbi:hypothetical protein TNCT_165971 [Trichonephila clavata]|uniref:Uncharacterized protein n=1 Tax=Trichonephila clavata TaxID=2740835 RepID=A0A8X6GQT1_TRICU|nr:hypothetical protein TNCT_165971 [Trichonephila clavata]
MGIAEKDYAKHFGDRDDRRAWFQYGTTRTVQNSIQIFWEASGTPLNFGAFFPLLSPTQKVEWIMIGWKDFNYVWLLKEFWRQTPDNFKELAKKNEA